MNNISYSILTKEKMKIGDDGTFRRSQPLDIHQQYDAFSLDGIKEHLCPIDRLQTPHTNSHQKMDHDKETLLKLNPYLTLDTDPTLDNLNFSNALSKPPHPLGTVPENCVCGVCAVSNIHVNTIKRSQSLDIHQQINALTSDEIKEQLCPIDHLQTLHTNLHQKMDHSKERLLKLSPYPILDTDPTLENLSYLNAISKSPNSLRNKVEDYTTQSMYEIEKNDRCNNVFQYHNNLGKWEKNENCTNQDELKNIDQFNYTLIKNKLNIKQLPVYCQEKIIPTVSPKPLISTNGIQKIECSYLTINNHLNNTELKDKDFVDIPNQKTLVNHVNHSHYLCKSY
uniref:Uncharacterized protein n=1 Tax=Schizaphis graminum TaxID=13262 RepID=A0A2S2N7U1_SCHGA